MKLACTIDQVVIFCKDYGLIIQEIGEVTIFDEVFNFFLNVDDQCDWVIMNFL